MDQPLPQAFRAAVSAAGYELAAAVGRGGSGSVFRAEERSSGEAVAVKLLDADLDADLLEREARALGRIEHSAIPGVRHVETDAPTRFLVTDWVAGTTLAHRLADSGSFPPQRAVDLFGQLADALDAVHEAGVVHCDLSPDNIIVAADDQLHLVDFGISRSASHRTVTAQEMASGTPRYVAPEVLEGAKCSPRSDQYAAAIVLYEMVTGAWAYPDEGVSVATVLHHHLHSHPIPPSEANHWLPSSIDEPILRALSKNPDDRFDSMADLADRVGTAQRTDTAQRIDGASADDHSGADTPAGPPLKSLVLGVVMFALAGAAIWVVASGGGDRAKTIDPALVSIDAWPAGQASSMSCNLLTQIDFENGTLTPGYFIGETDKNAIAPVGGVDQSRALLVGTSSDYGLYGERVAIEPGEAYLFSAHVSRAGEPGPMAMRLGWLDDSSTPIGDEDITFQIDEAAVPGQMTLRSSPAPPNARFAVAVLENGPSEGTLVADELVVASATSTCAQRLLPS